MKVYELKDGDIFRYENFEYVAIDEWYNGFLWVTTRNRYERNGIYTCTDAGLIQIDKNVEVEFIAAIEQEV